MCLSINKVISLKIALVFRFGFARERVKRRFLISDVAAGNILPSVAGLAGRL